MDGQIEPCVEGGGGRKVRISFHLLGGDVQTYLTTCIIGPLSPQVHVSAVDVCETISAVEVQRREAKI